jgi:CheY-like chemotaxis protein
MLRAQILIIDEDKTHQRLASLMAQRFGCEPIVATGVQEAIKKLNSNPGIQLVLLDLQIPRSEDGLKCLRALRRYRDWRRAGFAIIANTAHAMDADLAECIRLGADDALPKPYSVQHFREMVRKWTQDRERVRLAS